MGATATVSGELRNHLQGHGSEWWPFRGKLRNGNVAESGCLLACIGASLLFLWPGCGHANQGQADMAPEGAGAMESDQGPMYYSPEMVTPVGGPGMGYAQETMGGSAPCGMERGMCGVDMMACHGGIMVPGMMRAYGMHPILQLDLSDAQRSQINKTADGLRQQQWATMGKIMDERSKLRDLYTTEQPDPKQVGDVYGAIAKLREEMVVAQVKAHNEAVALLTKEQREQLKRWERGHWGPSGSAAGPAAQPSPPPAVPPSPPPVGQRQVPPPPPPP